MENMLEKMLINATQNEEIRVALIKNNYLYDLDIEGSSEKKKKGNIYIGIVTRIERSLNAIFVNYGSQRQGFLPLKEIAPEYFRAKTSGDENPPINNLIKEGQELLIQIDKEERGNKGAALTTFITLAGCYLVLMPNNPQPRGISRRIEGEERDELRDILNSLKYPEGMGVIIRTAGVGKTVEELQSDLDMLCNQWQAIKHAYRSQLAPSLIHQEGDVIIRSIRDNLRKTVSEIIIDDQVSYVKAKQYIEQVKPEFLPNLKLYIHQIPLFTFYQIESQIETAFQREVLLPSGGALVIDPTEALISIDVNSAKATSGVDIEATALQTNLEAADEIARQLRLRDLGGLVVIDFIDMASNKGHREVENRLKEAVKADRARIQMGRISLRFGLLEMSRQRLRPSLGEGMRAICPRCQGRGTIRNLQSHGLAIIRLIEEETLKEKTAEVQVQVPSEMATFLINEKREFILTIEKRHEVKVLIIANPYLKLPQYTITRVKEDNVNKENKASYELIERPELIVSSASSALPKNDEPAVKSFTPHLTINSIQQKNFFRRLWSKIFNTSMTPLQDVNNDLATDKKFHEKSVKKYSSNKNTGARRSTMPRKRNFSPQQRRPGTVSNKDAAFRNKKKQVSNTNDSSP